jgi:hypothetical protein
LTLGKLPLVLLVVSEPVPFTVSAPPAEAATSRTRLNALDAVVPIPFVAVTFCEPLALELAEVYVVPYGLASVFSLAHGVAVAV